MLSDKVLLAINNVPDEYLTDTWKKLNSAENTNKAHYKISRTALIAAVIAALLALSACAVGYSFYKRHQANVRNELGIDKNNVSGYMEYDEGLNSSIQLISSIDFGDYIRVYFCLSPVSFEEFEGAFRSGFVDKYLFSFYASNDERIGSVFETEMRGEEIPFAYDCYYSTPGISLSGQEQQEHMKEYTGYFGETYLALDYEYRWDRIADAYDEETNSLFLESVIRKSDVDTTKPVYIAVGLLDAGSVTLPMSYIVEHGNTGEWFESHLPVYLKNYGTVVMNVAQADCRTFDFSGEFIELTNPSNNGKLKILSATVYPTYLELKLTHDDVLLINNLPEGNSDKFQAGFEKKLEWVNFYDDLLKNGELLFSDGTALSLAPSATVKYENGIVTLKSYFTSTVDIQTVDKLKIFDSSILAADR